MLTPAGLLLPLELMRAQQYNTTIHLSWSHYLSQRGRTVPTTFEAESSVRLRMLRSTQCLIMHAQGLNFTEVGGPRAQTAAGVTMGRLQVQRALLLVILAVSVSHAMSIGNISGKHESPAPAGACHHQQQRAEVPMRWRGRLPRNPLHNCHQACEVSGQGLAASAPADILLRIPLQCT